VIQNGPKESASFYPENKPQHSKHSTYWPYLAPCDSSLFQKLKISLKGTRFQSTEDIHNKTAKLLKALSQTDFRRCFEDWKARMGQCVASDGNYFESGNMQIL
jgi:hypothetical protein